MCIMTMVVSYHGDLLNVAWEYVTDNKDDGPCSCVYVSGIRASDVDGRVRVVVWR